METGNIFDTIKERLGDAASRITYPLTYVYCKTGMVILSTADWKFLRLYDDADIGDNQSALEEYLSPHETLNGGFPHEEVILKEYFDPYIEGFPSVRSLEGAILLMLEMQLFHASRVGDARVKKREAQRDESSKKQDFDKVDACMNEAIDFVKKIREGGNGAGPFSAAVLQAAHDKYFEALSFEAFM